MNSTYGIAIIPAIIMTIVVLAGFLRSLKQSNGKNSSSSGGQNTNTQNTNPQNTNMGQMNAPKQQSFHAPHNQNRPIPDKVVQCSGCGARSIVKQGQATTCEYCGRLLG